MGKMKALYQDEIDKEFLIAEQRYTIAMLEVQIARLRDDLNALAGEMHALRIDTQ